jgi:hypothetical protein
VQTAVLPGVKKVSVGVAGALRSTVGTDRRAASFTTPARVALARRQASDAEF